MLNLLYCRSSKACSGKHGICASTVYSCKCGIRLTTWRASAERPVSLPQGRVPRFSKHVLTCSRHQETIRTQDIHIVAHSKRIAASCQTDQASFIAPYRNHHGHQQSLPPQMIRGGGRDGSDTVLHNIGSHFRHARRCSRSARTCSISSGVGSAWIVGLPVSSRSTPVSPFCGCTRRIRTECDQAFAATAARASSRSRRRETVRCIVTSRVPTGRVWEPAPRDSPFPPARRGPPPPRSGRSPRAECGVHPPRR